MAFPTSLDSFTTKVDNTDDVLATHVNTLQTAVVNIETKIGIDSSAVNTSLDYYLKHASGAYRTHTHDGTSDDGAQLDWDTCWSDAVHTHASAGEGGQISLTAAITGILPIANGGTGLSSAGGTANRVLLTTDGSALSMGQVNLTTMITGALPVANGGTGGASVSAAFTNIVVPKVYDSDWFSVTDNTNYSKTHNLGTIKVLVTIYVSNGNPGANIASVAFTDVVDGGYGLQMYVLTTTTISIRTGYLQSRLWDGASYTNPSYARIVILALE